MQGQDLPKRLGSHEKISNNLNRLCASYQTNCKKLGGFDFVQISGEEDVEMNNKFYGKLLEAASKAGRHLREMPALRENDRNVVAPWHGTEVMLSWPTNGSRKARLVAQQWPGSAWL